jgi:hypothetical protein
MAYTVIDNPIEYFNTLIWTGNGASSRAISSLGHQPDLCWFKERGGTEDHHFFDSVRGAGVRFNTNGNAASNADGADRRLLSFDSDGFTVGLDNAMNGNSKTYVSWNWKCESAFSNDASSTSVGSIDSAGKVNTTAGISIVKWTGTGSAATIAHGLGIQPQIVFVKNIDDTSSWNVYSVVGTGAKGLFLNENNGLDSDTSYFNSGTSSTTTFPVGTANTANGDGDEMMAYSFGDVKGYSKIGSYQGNGNADGTVVNTGFRPAWIMLKNTSRAASWLIFDDKREGYNIDNDELVANTTAAEETYDQLDILSNGFKLRTNGTSANLNGDVYLYMAFADSPFANSNGVPCNAR